MSGREDEVLQRQYWQELETEGTEFSPLEVTQNPHMSMVSCLSQLSATVTSPCNKKGGSFWLSFRGLDALLLTSLHLARQQVLGVACDRPSCLPVANMGEPQEAGSLASTHVTSVTQDCLLGPTS